MIAGGRTLAAARTRPIVRTPKPNCFFKRASTRFKTMTCSPRTDPGSTLQDAIALLGRGDPGRRRNPRRLGARWQWHLPFANALHRRPERRGLDAPQPLRGGKGALRSMRTSRERLGSLLPARRRLPALAHPPSATIMPRIEDGVRRLPICCCSSSSDMLGNVGRWQRCRAKLVQALRPHQSFI